MAADKPGAIKITKEQVDKLMVKVEVRMQQDAPAIKVEGEVVPQDQLRPVLSRFANDKRKTELLIDHSPRVPHGTIIAIQDAAKGAGFTKVHILIPPEELKAP